MQKLAVVALEIARDAHGDRLVPGAEMPAAELAALDVEREAVVSREIVQRTRRAVPLEILGRAADDAAVGREPDRDERRIDRAADAHAHVEAQAHEVDDLVGQVERNPHVGIAFDERRAMPRDVLAAESGRRRDEQMAGRRVPALADPIVGVLEIREQPAAVFEIDAALLGQREAARRSMQQAHAEPLFERVDPPADHHRRDLRDQRRTREAAGIDGGDKRLDLGKLVHAIRYVRYSIG